jgi:hypothetical protein
LVKYGITTHRHILFPKDEKNRVRRCPWNPEAGKKKNAHIKRDAARQKKQMQASTTATTSSATQNIGKKRKQREPMVSFYDPFNLVWQILLYLSYISNLVNPWQHQPDVATYQSQVPTRFGTQGNQARAEGSTSPMGGRRQSEAPTSFATQGSQTRAKNNTNQMGDPRRKGFQFLLFGNNYWTCSWFSSQHFCYLICCSGSKHFYGLECCCQVSGN